MGSHESEEMIPCLDFSRDGLGSLEEGSEEWKKMSKKVREACENYGCFLLMCDEIPKVLIKDMFMCLQALFDLPEETKRKHTNPKPFGSYTSECPAIPFCQCFGIDDPHLLDSAQAFTNLMWPQGNQVFWFSTEQYIYSETLKSMCSKMLEMIKLIHKMILEGFGLPKHYSSDIEDMNSTNHLRVMKYKVPKTEKDGELSKGLGPHTDKGVLTILCQSEVQGLQVLTKTNKWIQVNIPKDEFVVFGGDTLKAWSNGRLHAVTHRVMLSGDKERYTFGSFASPKEDMKIEVPPELVDDKIHPLRYRPLNFGDYIQYLQASTLNKENALDAFAGI